MHNYSGSAVCAILLSVVCPQADWAGCVLRMAGHDFVDFQWGAGEGCNLIPMHFMGDSKPRRGKNSTAAWILPPTDLACRSLSPLRLKA